MLLNYLRIAYRNLLKNKGFSFINIFGLGVGMAAFLFIIDYVRFERSYEDDNSNADNLFRITLDLYNGSEFVVTDCETHAPMGPIIKSKMPEVTEFVRMFHNDGLQDIRIGDQHFLEEGVYYADPSALKLFSVDLISGKPENTLREPEKAVLSAAMAKKLFGHTQIVGETITIDRSLYQVTGVFADRPANTHLKFSILLSHATLAKKYEWYKEEDNWNGNNEYTYLLMVPGTDVNQFNKKLADLCISLKDKLQNNRYVAQPVKDIHLHSQKTYEPEVNGNAKAVQYFLIIAMFIMVIAWVNYVNLSTARAIERAREVGIRKVMGSIRVQLVFQFLSESFIVNLFASLIALGIFQLALPVFRDLTGQPLSLSVLSDPGFWYLFFGLFAAGTILSGIYPAFVLSSFQPAAVLKGKFQSSSHGQVLRKGLVTFQFAATVILIASMITVYQQVSFLRNYDLGMNLSQTLAIRVPLPDEKLTQAETSYQNLKTELLRIPHVESVARSGAVPGLSLHEMSSTSIRRYGEEGQGGSYEYYWLNVDADYMKTLGIKLVAGRSFQDGVPNDDEVLVNEEAVKRLGYASPAEALGTETTFRTRGEAKSSTIIGVFGNYYQRSPKEAHIPMLFRYDEHADYFTLRLKTTDVHSTLADIRKSWDSVFAGQVFHYFFIDENYNRQYQADNRFGRVIASFSTLAVLIACLGLFGLSSFVIVQRTKEIGIRKVLGATVGQIVRLLSGDFIKVVLIAGFIAIPVAWFAMDQWLSTYAVRIRLTGWIFIIPVVAILAIALVTVSYQTIKTALANPAESLKQE